MSLFPKKKWSIPLRHIAPKNLIICLASCLYKPVQYVATFSLGSVLLKYFFPWFFPYNNSSWWPKRL